MDRNYKLRKQNRMVQLIQNIILTVLPGVIILLLMVGYGFLAKLWGDLGSIEGPVDDVQGYGMIFEGIAGMFGGMIIAVLFVLLILALGSMSFFWILFGLAYSTGCSEKRYLVCTIMDAALKILLIGGYLISNLTARNAVWLAYPAASVFVLYNLYTMRKR